MTSKKQPLPRGAHRRALATAFPHTLPVLTGFLFLGMTYGVLMGAGGFPLYTSVLTSLTVFAGSLQFVLTNLLLGAFAPMQALLLTLTVNARHLFYGISLLEKYRGAGIKKLYLIFGLCDETFSISYTAEIPEGTDRHLFYFFVTLLNHSYWVLGTLLGGLLGSFIPFNTEGLDFCMTALFVVIFLDQWQKKENRAPQLLGLGVTLLCLLLFGSEYFLLVAMGLLLLALTLLQGPLGREETL